MPPTDAVAALSALSSAVPVAVWFFPSVPSTIVLAQLLMPESASVQAKRIDTGELFQPFGLAAGAGVPAVIDGGVLSIRTVTSVPAETLPAWSRAVARIEV